LSVDLKKMVKKSKSKKSKSFRLTAPIYRCQSYLHGAIKKKMPNGTFRYYRTRKPVRGCLTIKEMKRIKGTSYRRIMNPKAKFIGPKMKKVKRTPAEALAAVERAIKKVHG
jgi:hypothetical protein